MTRPSQEMTLNFLSEIKHQFSIQSDKTLFSTIPLQLYPKVEVLLEWPDIFRRLIKEKRGGLCYERDELLYQVLIYLGFEAYRIECQAIKTYNYVISPRHNHMAVSVCLNKKWYLCDAGWKCFTCKSAHVTQFIKYFKNS